MSDAIIAVENLGKKYQITHQRAGQGSATLRETITEKGASLFRALALRNGKRSGGQSAAPPKHEEFWALRNVSFEVKRGEVLGIIGRNGAGKSTLLKLLSRITEPTEGRVRIRGRVASLLEVGTGFHPELTGRENVFLNGAILGMSRVEIKRKFDEIVDFAGIEKFIDTPVKRYSSGMYVRLAFAVAAHLEPEILIVDEVLAVGDAEFQKKCLGKMQDVSRGGRTVLFVSHNMRAILELCNRCVLLRSGAVAMDGLCEAVASHYLTDALSPSDGRIDLRSHPARHPSCQPIISQVTMRNGRGETASQFYPDEPITLDILTDPPSPVTGPQFAIAIEDSHGRRLMTLASYFNQGKSEFPLIDANAVARCQLDQLSLGPGRYLLSVSVATRHDGLLDSLDGVAWFEIVWNNNFEAGEPYFPFYGPLLKESKWTLLPGS